MGDEGGTEMAKKRRDVEGGEGERGRGGRGGGGGGGGGREGERERERERESERERGRKENERVRRRGMGGREHGAATACVSRLNECKPRSGGSPLDLLFSSPDSL
jgi:hypothetical protein